MSAASASPQHPAIHSMEIDGVRTLWTPAPAPFLAMLVVRVGQADEHLSNSGITHYVEHLAFPDAQETDLAVNGTVHEALTFLAASGDPARVGAFMRLLSSTFANLPSDRMNKDRTILLTEQANAASGINGNLLRALYGPRAHGLPGFKQLGLHRLDYPELQRWSDSYFFAENAVLVMSGPPPPEMRLELPHGIAHPPPLPTPLDQVLTPTWFSEAPNIPAALVPSLRTVAAGLAITMVQRRLLDSLRYGMGLSYSVQAVQEPVHSNVMHRYLVADAMAENAQAVTTEMVRILVDLAEHAPPGTEVEECRRSILAVTSDPRHGFGWAMHQAEQLLFGEDTAPEYRDYLEVLDSVTPEEVRADWETALQFAIVHAPLGTTVVSDRIRRLTLRSTPVTPGTTYPQARRPLFKRGAYAVLGHHAVSLVFANRSHVSVEFSGCAVMVREPGRRTLIGSDGLHISLTASDFLRGGDLLARLDEAIDPAVSITLPSPNQAAGGGAARP